MYSLIEKDVELDVKMVCLVKLLSLDPEKGSSLAKLPEKLLRMF